MFEKFKSFVSAHCDDNTYGERTSKSVREKFDDLSADLQKFRDALQRVVKSQLSGVKEKILISKAISILTRKCNLLNYSFREYHHEMWRNYIFFKALRSHPKYSDVGTSPNASFSSITELVFEEPFKAAKIFLLWVSTEEEVRLQIRYSF